MPKHNCRTEERGMLSVEVDVFAQQQGIESEAFVDICIKIDFVPRIVYNVFSGMQMQYIVSDHEE